MISHLCSKLPNSHRKIKAYKVVNNQAIISSHSHNFPLFSFFTVLQSHRPPLVFQACFYISIFAQVLSAWKILPLDIHIASSFTSFFIHLNITFPYHLCEITTLNNSSFPIPDLVFPLALTIVHKICSFKFFQSTSPKR